MTESAHNAPAARRRAIPPCALLPVPAGAGLLLPLLAALPPWSLAGEVRLAWDAVGDPRVAGYQVSYGPGDGPAARTVPSAGPALTLSDLSDGETYRFVVRACDSGATLCSAESDPLVYTLPVAAPVAGFSGEPRSGQVPHTVTFRDASSGAVDGRLWSLGDGSTATGITVVHTYTTSGSFDVGLTVSGPGGTDSELRPAYVSVSAPPPPEPEPVPEPAPVPEPTVAVIEAGELVVDHNWQWVPFEREFEAPVVVARGLSLNGGQPATVRIKDTGPDGFRVRVLEWPYLDGSHVAERLAFVAIESGVWSTEEGALIEAGTLTLGADGKAVRQGFAAEFADTPVVIATVAGESDPTAIAARLRDIDPSGFTAWSREQEADDQRHPPEPLAYLAIEPGAGTLDGWHYEAAVTPDAVTHVPYLVAFGETFAGPPLFLADMQTSDGGDPADLRWRNLDAGAVEILVQEEQSRDSETNHTTEVVGYLALEPADSPLTVVYEDAEDGRTDGWRIYDAAPSGARVSNVPDPARGSRVIALEGAGLDNGYILTRSDGIGWGNTSERVLRWDVAAGEPFRIYVSVQTSAGHRYLQYDVGPDQPPYASGSYVFVRLGEGLTDGAWHRIERDLAADLARAVPGLALTAVNAFLIRGNARLDDIGMR